MSMVRFLIADRDPAVREHCQDLLASRGFEVAVAADGIQCIRQLRDSVPTVLVLDPEILWGGGDGVLEWIYDQQPFAPLTVLLTDGDFARPLPVRLLNHVTARLQRPQNPQQMREFVARIEDETTLACASPANYNPLAVERVFR